MSTDIAIVGISCLFPGAATPDEFWRNLCAERDSTSPLDAARLGADPAHYFHAEPGRPDTTYWLRGGYIRGFQFDPEGYELPTAQLDALDDLDAWSLYVSREALADSGYLRRASVLARCGLVLGNLSFPTTSSQRLHSAIYADVVELALREALGRPDLTLPRLQGTEPLQLDARLPDHNPTGLVARALGLGGARFALDAACASSLYALDLACRYLRAGKADLMLAGAVSAADPLFINIGFSCFRALPYGGESRPLDRASRGLIAGEGAGALVLKRYDEAVRDGDHIYARIPGIGLSNDGRGSHPLRPNAAGQLLAFERAYSKADLDPRTIAYVECHATGTPTGDSVELQTMETFFGDQGAPPRIGSVKSNFGHLLTAAGMAGVLKVLLALQHDLLPATIHVEDPLTSPRSLFDGAQIVRTATPWPAGRSPRRAAVSAFGLGGANAHLVLEEPGAAPEPAAPPSQSGPLAIIGMDACFGGAQDLDAFRRVTFAGTPQFVELPPTRWKGFEERPEALPVRSLPEGHAPSGAYIESFSLDFIQSKIPPQPTDQPIAQQLLLLKVADRALRDAGMQTGGRVAVLVAMSTDPALHQYRGRLDLSWQIRAALVSAGIGLQEPEIGTLEAIAQDCLDQAGQVNRYTSFIGNIMASRVSALWDFTGPAFTISAGDLSVVRALEVAQLLLDAREVDAVVLGAVDLAGGMESVLARSRCAPIAATPGRIGFDQQCTGWTVGEGAGAVVLRQAKRAQQDGNRVYATVHAMSLVAQRPTTTADADAVELASRQAHQDAGIDTSAIGYLEVLGTGARSSDAAEIDALTRAYRAGQDTLSCALGSATATFGHTQAASGMASLIRTALALHQRAIPATPGWTGPLAPERWRDGPFYVSAESRPWFLPAGAARRYAAIAMHGLDGIAAHIVLAGEPASQTSLTTPIAAQPIYLLPVTTEQPSALLDRLADLQEILSRSTPLAAVADWAVRAYRERAQARFALVLLGRDREELLAELEHARAGLRAAFASGREWTTPLGSYFTPRPLGARGAVAFVYPGSSSSYLGMGRGLFRLFPGLHDRLEHLVPDASATFCERLLYPRSLMTLDDADLVARQATLTGDVQATVASATAHAYLSTAVLRECFGVQPSIAFGYSIGEAMMLRALGAWPAQAEANAARWTAARMSERIAGAREAAHTFWSARPGAADAQWQTYVLLAAPARVAAALSDEPRVFVTMIHTPGEVCIAGDPAACARVIARLGCTHAEVPSNYVLHSPPTWSAYDDLVEIHRNPTSSVPGITFYTGATGAPLALDEGAVAQAIATVICQTVDFPRLVNRVYADGARIFVEPGPSGACSRWIHQILGDREHVTVACDMRGMEDGIPLFQGLARLISHRLPVDLSVLAATHHRSEAQPSTHSLVRAIVLGGTPLRPALAAVTARLTVAPAPVFSALGVDAVAKELCEVVAKSAPPASPSPQTTQAATPSAGGELQPSWSPAGQDVALTHPGLRMAVELSAGAPAPAPAVTGPAFPGCGVASRAHVALLHARGEALEQLRALIDWQLEMARHWQESAAATQPAAQKPVWDQADLLEFAQGSIARVFGSTYAAIDGYRRRVRLPLPPYLLVSRVTRVDATPGELRPASITTEYDIPRGAWYTVDEQAPQAIAVESGQCDLLLISYLGIDLENRGERVYRLLDCTLTFFDDLPCEGQTLRYEIRINSYVRSGETLLFFFSYDCFIGGRLILTMRDGCAGFFSDADLAQGQGVVTTARECAARGSIRPQTFTPLLACAHTHFDRMQLLALSAGDSAGCFGSGYELAGRNRALRLPPAAMLMLDRIGAVDSCGGIWGLGALVAEKDLRQDDWYFTCHFKDDPVLAGSLMAEGCVQLLQFYMLYLGLQTRTHRARFQPIPGLAQAVHCRGQVTPRDARLTYRMEITELGLEPVPYAMATIDILVGSKIVVRFDRLGLRLVDDTSATVIGGPGHEAQDADGYAATARPAARGGITMRSAQALHPERTASGIWDESEGMTVAHRWTGPRASLAFSADAIAGRLRDVHAPCYVVHAGDRLGVAAGDHAVSAVGVDTGLPVQAMIRPFPPERLGDHGFKRYHGVRMAYMAGAMANGIASERMVIALGRAGILASFGAAGLPPTKVEAAIHAIQKALPHGPYAFNLIHSPSEEALERAAVELYVRHGVTTVEASAYLNLTLPLVRYRVAGLSLSPEGDIQARHRLIAKVSRREVATRFLSPAPTELVRALLDQGLITELQARLAELVPLCDDLTVEADSGGHTDNRPLVCLVPAMLALRNQIQERHGYAVPVRIGAAGGIGTPYAALAAFSMGAAYIVTGSVNQSCLESGASMHTRALLAQAEPTDVIMAPAADMFELGVKVQLLKRGTLFPVRAQWLYELYRRYDSLAAIPAAEREKLERQIFRRSLDAVWEETVAFFQARDPEQIARAASNPKRKMALVFRWYLGLSSRWSIAGEPGRETDYQIWCGPAMGAFNAWVRGSYLQDPARRSVIDVAEQIMTGAAYLARIQDLQRQGVGLKDRYTMYAPIPLAHV